MQVGASFSSARLQERASFTRLVLRLCAITAMLSAPAWAGNLTVSWAANKEPDLAGYKIYYSSTSGNYAQHVDAKLALKYVFSDLTEGQTYYFVVTAYDTANNESAYSTEVSAQVPITDKTPPTIVSVKVRTATQLEVKFSEPVTLSSSQKLGNYSLTPALAITRAVLQADTSTVVLTTASHLDGKSYALSVKDVIDRAVPANKIVSPTVVNYAYHAPDNTAPTLVSVIALTATQVEVRFSEAITKASAEEASNYAITPQINIAAARLQADSSTVWLTTAAHADAVNYTLSVQNIQDRATPPNPIATPATKSYQFRIPDTTPPVLVAVRVLQPTQLEVQFSEAITKISAEKIANYTITPLRTITNAALRADARTVLLTTAPHVEDESYTLNVKAILDRATPANQIVVPAALSYEYHAPDTQAPTLVSVRALAATQVEIRFSEAIAKSSAETLTNYQVAPSVNLAAAWLQADGRTVLLTTAPHLDGVTYTVSVQNIQDLAVPPNTIAVLAMMSYKFQIADTTPPTLLSAQARNANEVEVRFSEALASSAAENISNYSLSPSLALNTATLQNDTRTVVLKTATHADGTIYTLRVQNLQDRATPPNMMATTESATYQFVLADKKAPSLTEIRALDESKVELRFDEPVTRSSAENLANYSIDQGINITGVTLHSDERGVVLGTSPHLDGVTYQLTVRKLADRASPANVMPAPTTHSYRYLANDVSPPRVASAVLTNLTTLVVTFSERVTSASAENFSNYLLSDNMRVVAARLDAFEQEVTLTVTEHVYNHAYVLRLSGVVDASTNANRMTDTLRFVYSLQGSGEKQNGNLTVSRWTPTYFAMDTLRLGQRHYTDLAASVTHVPMRLRNMLMFRTANRDRQMKAETFFEFTLNHMADVYVAYDSRAEEVPQWLRAHFIDNNQRITVTMPGGASVQMKVWKGRFLPGPVQLGANLASGAKASVALNMYFVLVDDLELNGTEGNEPPQLFELANNYPNPLRLNAGATQTVIECRLRQEGRVVVKVYNMLGQAVRTLHDGVLSAGTHPLIWNGRDDNAEEVPSGKYLYALEILEEVKQGDFTLTASLNRQTKVMTVLR